MLERPLITIMLRHRDELSLSPQQVQDLENLREGYEREAIRYEADIRIAEMDLQRLLKTEPVDLEQVKVKLQEIEHQKTQIRLARIQTIEQEKSLLSPEQYEKLQSLLGESRRSQLEVPGGRWLLAAFAALLIIIRTEWEDRMLHAKLDGYAAYAKQVPFRLIPGMW